MPTIAQEIRRINTAGGGVTTNATGVGVRSSNGSGIAAALQLGKVAHVNVLCLGTDKSVEHEGIDRRDILLPGLRPLSLCRSLLWGSQWSWCSRMVSSARPLLLPSNYVATVAGHREVLPAASARVWHNSDLALNLPQAGHHQK